MNNGKICISVCAETADELIEQIKRAETLADVIEIRFDCLHVKEFDTGLEKISDLKFKKPFLATLRPKNHWEEFFYGKITDEKVLEKKVKSSRERIDKWNKIFSISNLKFIDLEEDLFIGLIMSEFFEKEILSNHEVIFSHHNFSSVPDDLEETHYDLFSAEEFDVKCDIIKIAAQTHNITDTIPIWQLLEKAKSDNKQIIPIAMGESGKWTRILGLAHGAFMTYAALDSGKETAPGQISAEDLTKVYRVKELDENTEIYGILGSNTSVSMSPYIHNAAFKFHNLNAVFVPLQTHNLDEFIKRMVKPETRDIELNFKGFSVTLPHKQAIIKHLDFMDDAAKEIGAVNTVKIIDGKLCGYNTDADGFIEPLKNAYGDLKNVKVAILGAGGAARACIYALKHEGANVTIFARDLKKAESLIKDFGVDLRKLSTQHLALGTYKDFEILINTTPLGMKGKADNETPALAKQLEGLNLVYDLIYIPFQTPLMTEADKANVPKIGGLAMLIAQAMRQQKIWTGLDAPMKEMSRAALEKLS